MKPHPARTSAPRREEGIALVVVLLFTAVVLTIVVSTTATLAVGARGGGVNERAAYQALLAAESGLNTFEVRFRTKMESLPLNQRLRGNVGAARFNAWLLRYGLNSYSTGTDQSTSLAFDTTVGADSLVLVATGAPGLSQKVVLQNYQADYAPGYNIRADAPLVSYPNVNLKGGARVEGERLTDSDNTGVTAVARTNVPLPGSLTVSTTATNPTFPLSVTKTLGNRLLLAANDYVDIGGISYKVMGTRNEGTQVTLQPLIQPSVNVITDAASIKRIDSAVTASFTQQSGVQTVIQVSDPTFFVKDSVIQIGTMKGTVKAVDIINKTLEVLWDSAPSGTVTQQEGSVIRRDVKSVSSGYTVDGDVAAMPDGANTNDLRLKDMNPFNPAADTEANDLFTHTFGQTKREMLNVAPFNVNLTAEDPQPWVNPVTTFNGTVTPDKIVFFNGTLGLSGNQSLCGSGILIVKGNLTVNGTCDAGFRGAIYVMGDYDQQGNSKISGAVIAEGATEIVYGTECVPTPGNTTGSGSGSGNSCDTQVAGTGQGDGKIAYDRGALLEAGSLLTPPTFSTVQGTWRQR